MRLISFIEKKNDSKKNFHNDIFYEFRNNFEYTIIDNNNFLKINNFKFKKLLSSSNSHIYKINNTDFNKEFGIECKKKLVIRLSRIENLISNIDNKIIYAGRNSKFTYNVQNYDYEQRADEEIFIQIISFKNNLSPDFFYYNYDITKKFCIIMIMEFIDPKYFLNNIFLFDKDEIIFSPPYEYDYQTIKKLFYESISKLHNLNIIHNDLIYLKSFKYHIRNSYLDVKANKIKFIDFGLSYIVDNENLNSDKAKKLEIDYIDSFFNQFDDYYIKN